MDSFVAESGVLHRESLGCVQHLRRRREVGLQRHHGLQEEGVAADNFLALCREERTLLVSLDDGARGASLRQADGPVDAVRDAGEGRSALGHLASDDGPRVVVLGRRFLVKSAHEGGKLLERQE